MISGFSIFKSAELGILLKTGNIMIKGGELCRTNQGRREVNSCKYLFGICRHIERMQPFEVEMFVSLAVVRTGTSEFFIIYIKTFAVNADIG